jgi:hypothetical protein
LYTGEHNALAQWSQWNIFAVAFMALLNRADLVKTAGDDEQSAHDSDVMNTVLLLCLISVPVLAVMISVNDYTGGRIPQQLSKFTFRLKRFMKRTREHHQEHQTNKVRLFLKSHP